MSPRTDGVRPAIHTARLADNAVLEQLLRQGVTTLLGQVDCTDEAQLEALESLSRQTGHPLNVGFLALAPPEATPESLSAAISRGILGC